MEDKEKTLYLLRIKELASNPESKDYLAANKYLLEEPWLKPKVGRPSKDAIKFEADKLFEDQSTVDAHFNRMFKDT